MLNLLKNVVLKTKGLLGLKEEHIYLGVQTSEIFIVDKVNNSCETAYGSIYLSFDNIADLDASFEESGVFVPLGKL